MNLIRNECKQHFLKTRHIRQCLRCLHTSEESSTTTLYPLESRSLLKVTGNEASVFLQGLITNDMRHFEEGAKSVYAMFLNNKGRVLFDTLIHKWDEGFSFVLECDSKIANILEKHLKVFKLRRKVTIENISNQYKLWSIISSSDLSASEKVDIKHDVNIYKDPRLIDLGHRVISATPLNGSKIAAIISNDVKIETNDKGYRYLRYKLGVSEGADDLPPGTSFPLEVNCDYLHGVSFHKGCYIGQELTARIHHTGVVRKRIMPIKFSETVNEDLHQDTAITACNNSKLNLGKLKGVSNDYGLGLVRIKEALEAKDLHIGKYMAVAVKPDWWPIEAPKELQKTE